MGATSKISWTDASWTPIRARVKDNAPEIAAQKGYSSLVQIAERMKGHVGPHCEHASSGCDNCYSETNNSRCLPANGTGLPFDRRSRDLVDIFLDEKILMQPLHWKKPRKIFVCSQTDLFGEFVTDEIIDRVFAVMALCRQHTFQVLTKRAERMNQYLADDVNQASAHMAEDQLFQQLHGVATMGTDWPLSNVWLGVSVEDQKRADERIPHLLRTPAAVRFLSVEPMLEAIEIQLPRCGCSAETPGTVLQGSSFHGLLCDKRRPIHWVICGGESGPNARPFDLAWARSLRDQCEAAGVAFFMKQIGSNPFVSQDLIANPFARQDVKARNGDDTAEWPEDLRIQQFPEPR